MIIDGKRYFSEDELKDMAVTMVKYYRAFPYAGREGVASDNEPEAVDIIARAGMVIGTLGLVSELMGGNLEDAMRDDYANAEEVIERRAFD